MRQTLITGATSGLGRALVDRLSASDSVIAHGRNRAALDELARSAKVAATLTGDLSRPDVADELLAGHEIDVLINNAGVLPSRAHLAEMTAAAIDAMVDVNFRAVIHLTRAALRGMRARGRGHVVFIGSSAARSPHPGLAVYGATKAGIGFFADALRVEHLGERIRITEVAPGRIRSNLYRDVMENQGDLYDDYEPLEPEDVAETVAFALDAPAHVDVSRIEVFPTSQAVGGGRIVKRAEMK